MAVRSDAYCREGGMNLRKAGEDFYFLHKYTLDPFYGTITDTCVIPAARKSTRVPFGTGRAMIQAMEKKGDFGLSYNPKSIEALKAFFEQVLSEGKDIPNIEAHSKLPDTMQSYLSETGYQQEWNRIQKHSKNNQTFYAHFFRSFNAFRIMKFLHFSRDHFHPDIEVRETSRWLLGQYNTEAPDDIKAVLRSYRQWDRLGTL
jgi:hypothetical protein